MPDPSMLNFLRAAGLARAGDAVTVEPLSGGVASDIVYAQAGGRCVAVKRALAKLRVQEDWQVPTARNASEVAWLQCAAAVVPAAVPRVLAHDPRDGLFAMTFFDSASHLVWKTELAAGRADPAFAAAVGRTLAAIHAATALRPALAERFANQALFRAIRVDPYLHATVRRHPDLARHLMAQGQALLASRIALVHGDVSPKNILCGPRGPVLLDAECACYGDPVFDAAFCLTHLLLKCVWRPPIAERLLACFDALAAAWLEGADWEPREALERRVAALVPALLLARVDGKSPVEYLTDEASKARVREFARAALLQAPADPARLRHDWSTSARHAVRV